MVFCDGYGNAISTKKSDARDHYDNGVQLFLGADFGAAEAFKASVTADPGFALGHVGLAQAPLWGWSAGKTRSVCPTGWALDASRIA